MNEVEIIAVGVTVLIVSLALFYIYREKKKGKKCIGCPFADQCKSQSCNCQNLEK